MTKTLLNFMMVLGLVSSAYSNEPVPDVKADPSGDFYVPKEYSSVELTQLFHYDIEEVGGMSVPMSWAISPDDQYLGLYFVNAMGKLYNDVLIRISDSGPEEVDLEKNKYGCDLFEGAVGFSGDSKQFYALKACKKLIFWDTETGAHVADIESGDDKTPYVMVGSGILKYENGKIQSSHGYMINKRYFKYSGSDGGGTQIIKLENDPSTAAFTPDHKIMAIAGGFSKSAHLYNMETGDYLGEFPGSKKSIKYMTFSADGQNLILSEGKALSIVDTKSGAICQPIPAGSYTWSLDVNRYNILGYVSKEGVMLWDLNGNRALTTVQPVEKSTCEVLFNHEGTRMYLIHSGGFLTGWEINYVE